VATVAISVAEVNDAPAADDQAVTTDEDTAVAITLTASDVDSTTLTFTVGTGPSHGTLTGSAPNLSYQPAADYSGADSFTFTANDGVVDSNVATVTITVTEVNDAPTADDQIVTTDEDTALAITLTASDVDNPTLTYSVGTGPTHGNLTGTAPNLSYQPAAEYSGPDSFTFTANDGAVDSNVATVTITVTEVNDAPSADDNAVTTPEDMAVAITLTANDIDSATLTYSVGAGPTHGTLSGTVPNLSYQPAADYNGLDSFTFTANDGAADSNVATVTITVTAVNDAPSADDQAVTTDEDTKATITLTASDIDNPALTYTVGTGPAHGTLTGTAPNLSYQPTADYNGPDSFTFTANDGALDSNVATVTITVTEVNDPPTADDQAVTTDEDTAVAITLTASDVDSTTLTYTVVAGPTHGALSGAPPSVSYQPAGDYSGPDSFTFTANDGALDSIVATVTITVTAVNDAPIADDQAVTTNEDTAVAIMLTASDIDSTTLTYTVGTGPAHGTLTGTAPNLSYQPAADHNGPDSFTFTANDGAVDSNVATVTITVTAVNDPPIADDQAVTTDEDTAVSISLTASDIDSTTLTYTVVTSPTHGTLSGTAPNLSYQPTALYSGPDSFTFTANDGHSDSNIGTVSITVNQVTFEPTISIGDVSVTEGDSGMVDAVFSLTLSEAYPLEVTVSFATSDGTAMAGSDFQSASGTVVFSPMTLSQTVTVTVVGDLDAELDENFFVDLTSPANATVGDSRGQGTILNDDSWTWYVVPTGDDAADCITPSTPCLTIGEAVTRAFSGDTIQVASGLYPEVLSLSKSLTVNGSGAVLEAPSGQLVVVSVSAGATVTLSHFEIRNGTIGGVENFGGLTLLDCWIHSNGDGRSNAFGGVATSGTGRMERCTVSGNLGDTSGGVANFGQLDVVNSTIQGNAAAFAPGIYNPVGGTLDLRFSTVAENGAFGIRGGGTVRAEASIIALHGTANCETAIDTLGHNLEDGFSCGLSAPAGDLIGVDPMLQPLGPAGRSTPTMALSLGSPAIDTGGSAGCLATDQRGVGRPIDGDKDGSAVCDIGAFEFQFVSVFTDGFESGDFSAWSSAVGMP
jgi:hypothetical protein